MNEVGVSIVQDDDQTASAINYLEEIVANALRMYAPNTQSHYLDIFIDQRGCLFRSGGRYPPV